MTASSPEAEVAAPPALGDDELRRYGRHLTLPEVGLEGQKRLKAARVLLVGAGGLGSPAALYLAAAGVGTLGLVDDDRVEESNLQRQVLYGHADLGEAKVEAARARLADVNPYVSLEIHPLRLGPANVRELVADYDVVVDGSDNAATRYLVNDACVLAHKPDVWGAVDRFEGQAAVFWSPRGPCYRCLFPQPPPPGLVASCAEAGVLGVLPGLVGSLQASEAIKLILDVGEPLLGRLVIFDALGARFREVAITRSPTCPMCGETGAGRRGALAAVEGAACERPDERSEPGEREAMTDKAMTDKGTEEVPFEIGVEELERWLEEGRELTVLDVREPQERDVARIEGSSFIPLGELPQRYDELDPDGLIVAHCHHGARSAQAVAFLRQAGYERAINLAGGIDAWSREVDPKVPRY